MNPIKYAIYPGSVTLYDGTVVSFTALELATAYGVQDEDYLVVNSNADIPQGISYVEYIHLKPRRDGIYVNIMDTAQDDGEAVTMGEDFDGNKKYIQETDRKNFNRDIDKDEY